MRTLEGNVAFTEEILIQFTAVNLMLLTFLLRMRQPFCSM